MMILATLLLLAVPPPVDLRNDQLDIPAGEWRWDPLDLARTPVAVIAEYEVASGGHDVRLALMRRRDLEHLSRDEPHGVVALTGIGSAGRLYQLVHTPEEYILLVDNRAGKQAAHVRLHVALDFAARPGPEVRTLPAERRWTVIAMSLGLFACVVGWSGRRLLGALRR
jgi:hypothetical protein